MPELVVPGVPDLPDEPRRVEWAHTCSGWVEIPKGERPTCGRCAERRERYAHVAAGHGTVAEIREAISALAHVDGQVPLGETVRMKLRGMNVWACPRSVRVEHDGRESIAVDALPNRRARRRAAKGRRR